MAQTLARPVANLIDLLARLPGVGEKLAARLVAAGHLSLAMLANATVEALQEIEGIGPKSAERILQVAQEAMAQSAPPPAERPSAQ